MVKNMLPVITNACEDYSSLKIVKTTLVSAKVASDLCEKKELIARAKDIIVEAIHDDDNTWMLENILYTALELAGSGAILHNNLNRMISLAEKELSQAMERLEKVSA